MTNQLQHQQRRAIDLRIPAIEKYAYCLCLHVKPTTIFIAVFKLIRALLFASRLLNDEFSVDHTDVGLSTFDDGHRSTAAAVSILTRIIMASVSAVGIYAVISGRAALLMPLYAILLVDFFFALPAFYNRDIDPSLADNLAEFRTYSNGNNEYARYSLMLFSTITMIVKIYFLCVIWKCYRYLRLIELVSPIRLSEFYPHIHQNGNHQYPPIVRVLGSSDSSSISNSHNIAPPPYESIAANIKPPNYEEAMKSNQLVGNQLPNLESVNLGQPYPPTSGCMQALVIENPAMNQQQAVNSPIGDEIPHSHLNTSVSVGHINESTNSALKEPQTGSATELCNTESQRSDLPDLSIHTVTSATTSNVSTSTN